MRVSEANVEKLRGALRDLHDDPSIDDIRAEDLGGAYPAVRYVSPDGSLVVYVLARLGSAFAYDDLEVERPELGGVPVRVASPRAMYRMKRGSMRSRDHHDAARLRSALGSSVGDATDLDEPGEMR